MAKKCEKCAQEPPKRRGIIWSGGLRVPLSGPCLESEKLWKYIKVLFNHAGGGPPRIVTLRGAARGSYDRICPSRTKSWQTCPKSAPDVLQSPQKPPNLCPNQPKTIFKPPKIDPKSILESILDPCLKKARFQTSKKRPRGAQEVPRPSQILPKWSPKPFQIWFPCDFWAYIFPFQFWSDSFTIFCCFLNEFWKLESLKIVVFSRGKRYFLKNHIFR